MTMQADIGTELLGLTGAFPRPGWVVLDALRERRFTGEVVVTTSIDVTVYVDTGRIYFAERHGDPSLGLRLVDAGTLAAAELADGTDALTYSAGFLLTTATLHGLGVAVGILGVARLKMLGAGFGLLCAAVGVGLLVGV